MYSFSGLVKDFSRAVGPGEKYIQSMQLYDNATNMNYEHANKFLEYASNTNFAERMVILAKDVTNIPHEIDGVIGAWANVGNNKASSLNYSYGSPVKGSSYFTSSNASSLGMPDYYMHFTK